MMIVETTSRECCQPHDLIAASPVKVCGFHRHKRCKYCRLSWVLYDAAWDDPKWMPWRPEDPVPEVANAVDWPIYEPKNYGVPQTLIVNSKTKEWLEKYIYPSTETVPYKITYTDGPYFYGFADKTGWHTESGPSTAAKMEQGYNKLMYQGKEIKYGGVSPAKEPAKNRIKELIKDFTK